MLQGRFHVALLLALAISLSACSSMSFAQRLLIWNTGFDVAADIAYGDDPRQKLDIYTPRGAKPRATVVFLYGGGWTSGTKSLYRFVGQALTSRGYQVVVPDYRLYPRVRYPGFVEDAAKAVGWVHANIGTHGGDSGTLLLMGHSAGAYNAAMIALDPTFLAPYGLKPDAFRAAVLLAGPVSFNPLKTQSTKDIFATVADRIDTARPVRIAVKGAAAAPPMLLLHGEADTTVNFSNSQHLADAVNQNGGKAAVKLYPKVSHLGVVTCFAWPLRWQASCLDDVDIFFQGALAQAPAPKPEGS